jgi:hypothetical protein
MKFQGTADPPHKVIGTVCMQIISDTCIVASTPVVEISDSNGLLVLYPDFFIHLIHCYFACLEFGM